jgi:hypothetical protein
MPKIIVVKSTVGGWDVRVARGATFSHHRSREDAERAAEQLRKRGPRLRGRATRRPS